MVMAIQWRSPGRVQTLGLTARTYPPRTDKFDSVCGRINAPVVARKEKRASRPAPYANVIRRVAPLAPSTGVCSTPSQRAMPSADPL